MNAMVVVVEMHQDVQLGWGSASALESELWLSSALRHRDYS